MKTTTPGEESDFGTEPDLGTDPDALSKHLGLVDPVTVAVFLAQLRDVIESVIQAARNAGLALEIEAGREINNAIENAKNAYLEVLNKSIDKVKPEIKGVLWSLREMVQNLEGHIYDDIDLVTKRAQQIVNSLPFRKHEPQLTKTSPRFVVPSIKTYPVPLQFEGDFEFAAKEGFLPTVTVNNKVYGPVGNGTQNLVFHIPVDELLASSPAGDPAQFSYAKAKLLVPWEKSGFLGIGKKRMEDSYGTVIGLLPRFPGSIFIEHSIDAPITESRAYHSVEFYQTSADDGGNDDRKDVPYVCYPDSGFTVVRGTQSFEERHVGDCSAGWRPESPTEVAWWVTTIHHSIGTSGQIWFRVHFWETRTIPHEEFEKIPVQLSWGDSRSFNIPAGRWKVVFEGFDGTHQEWTSPDIKSPFLKVSADSSSLTISAANPATLIWPPERRAEQREKRRAE